MISVLVVFGLLAVAGLLALRSLGQLERATSIVASVDTGPWRQLSTGLTEVTDTLERGVTDRTDG